MPAKKKCSYKDREKIAKVYKICNNAKRKYRMSSKKTERCILKLKRKFDVKKSCFT